MPVSRTTTHSPSLPRGARPHVDTECGRLVWVGALPSRAQNAQIEKDPHPPCEPFSFFSMSLVALPAAVAGIATLALLAPRLLDTPGPASARGAARDQGDDASTTLPALPPLQGYQLEVRGPGRGRDAVEIASLLSRRAQSSGMRAARAVCAPPLAPLHPRAHVRARTRRCERASEDERSSSAIS